MRSKAMKNMPVRYYSSVSSTKVNWLWYPYIPYGKITVVQGDPGDGKTTLILNLAAYLSVGKSMPFSDEPVCRGKILYQSAEDGAGDTLKPRLISAGADCSNVAFIDDSDNPLFLDSPRLESAIQEIGAKLLVFDPLQAFLGENNGMNRSEGVRPMLKKLTSIAERTRCAVVIIGHMNKAAGAKGLYRGLGSIDIAAIARSILLIGRINNSPNIRVMTHLKSSLAKEGPPIAFEITEQSCVQWIGECEITIEELLGGSGVLEDKSKVALAERLLQSVLAEGAKPCSAIYLVGANENIGKRTIDTAKKNLGVKSHKHIDGWYWSLQNAGDPGKTELEDLS